MQITRAADYAVRVMVHMASLPPGARVQRHALAESSDAPEAFLSKVLQNLVAAGLLISHRGAGGGFQLAVPAAAVSLLDVVEAVDGPLQLNLCVGLEPSCERQPLCVVHPVWEEAQAALISVLNGISMARLGRQSNPRPAVTPSQPPNGDGPVPDPSNGLS